MDPVGATNNDYDVTGDCGQEKLRLVKMRNRLEKEPAEALVEALKRKREVLTDELPLGAETLADLRVVIERDTWDGQPTGKAWVKEWLREGEDWARMLAQRPSAEEGAGPHYCRLCWKPFDSDQAYKKHMSSKDHQKRNRTWKWKLGVSPEEAESDGEVTMEDASAGQEVKRKEVLKTPARAGRAAELLAQAEALRATPAASAKRRLLMYRNNLSAEERACVVRRIGFPRANDVAGLQELQAAFDDGEVSEDLAEVGDKDWIYKEATFSWLSGFYWHPESTRLLQQRPTHHNDFCHLCEIDCWGDHFTTRRHAENALHWAESNGALEFPSQCRGCPSSSSGCTAQNQTEANLDLEHRRAYGKPDAEVPEEAVPPTGFRSVHRDDEGSTWQTPYIAVTLTGDARICGARVASSRLRMGPKEKPAQRKKRWCIDLDWCEAYREWRSLAIPVPAESAAQGEEVDLAVQVRWAEEGPWEELNNVTATVPAGGNVAVIPCRQGCRVYPNWVETVGIYEFVADAQIRAHGGIEALRGKQVPLQFASDDLVLSFLMYIPEAPEPAPTLMFFHGDMLRSSQQCPRPGLADFVDVYGPALMAISKKKAWHPCRSFVIITPCCSDKIWWLRHPAEHDSSGYAVSMERCLRGLIQWTRRLGITPHEQGVCFAGQSMGAYMALEIARAMPEETQAVAAGAPCFDACRLDHLARRLVNVPVWLFIGRNDAMCSFEEVASLALKMRDLDAKLVRLTSCGIKGHSEVGAKLEKQWLYEWLLDPLA